MFGRSGAASRRSAAHPPPRVKCKGRIVFLAADVVLLLTGLWCFTALVFCSGWIMALFFAAIACCGRYCCKASFRNLCFQLVIQLPVMVWFWHLAPAVDTVYQAPWAKTAEVTVLHPFVVVNNVRDFHYRTETDYDVRYVQELYDLRQMESLHLAVSHWDGLEKIAHTMLSFSFRDGKRIVLSVETRVPEGKRQGAWRGLFKQFGLGMVWGTERDLLQLRTRFRRETLYFYPTTATPEEAAELFLALMEKTKRFTEKPVFYNTLFRNCTTVLAEPVLPVLLNGKLDIRLFLNGFFDELVRDAGFLQWTGEDFSSVKNHCRIPEFLPGGDEEYSDHIHKIAR